MSIANKTRFSDLQSPGLKQALKHDEKEKGKGGKLSIFKSINEKTEEESKEKWSKAKPINEHFQFFLFEI